MPRRGENIYKRKDGRWEGRYIRGRTPAGKAEYGYVYAKSYAACREKRRRMEDALPQKPMLTGEMSVCQAAEFFLSERRGALKASTIGRYEYMIRHYIVPEIGTILLRDLTAEKLSVFFSRLQDRGLSCKSTRDVGVLLKTIFKVVKKKCHCDCPGRDVELPAYRSKKVEVFADHEIAALAQKVLDAPDITGLCALLILNTGLRLGEICALRKSDIDFRSGFLRIEHSVARVRDASGTHLVVQSPKSSSSVRLVAIPNDMLELLKTATQNIQKDNYLLTNTNTPMEPRTLQYRYRKLLERCGIRYRNFHALRHTYATRCMESGVDIKSLSELLGHADIRTTLQTYADYSEGYFAHTNTTPKNAMATYQGCYATQWYLGFLNNGGAGHPYSLYYRQFDFSRKLSTEADITSFTLEGKQGVFTTEGGDNIITVTLPAGTPLNDMHPQLQLSDYATLLAPDLTGGITFVKDTKTAFTVQAEDGKTTKTYYVVVKLSDEEKPSGAEIYTDTIMLKDANILRDLDILGKNITTGADSTDIELLLDAGKDTSNLMIYARLSYGATASPALDGKKGMNLSDWTTFTITSGDGANTRTYRIKATARTQASISAFSLTIGGTVYEGVIDDKANTITVSGVDDSNLSSTSFTPDVTLGPETLVCSPAPGLAQDFSRTVQYIVAGDENVVSRTYTVSVLNKAGQLISGSGGGGGSDPVTPATGAKITAFSVLGVDGVINQSAGTITVTLPAGTNVTAVAPSVTVTAGAVVSPVSGEVVNLTVPVVYTVTLGEETSRYTVTVTFERSVSQQLWDELGNNSDVADHQTSHTKRDWS